MEKNGIQPVFFNEQEHVLIHVKIKPFHKVILDTIDDNTSNAIRIVIEKYYKYNQSMNMDKFLINFCLGMMLIGIGLLIGSWLAIIIFYAGGIGIICYGTLFFIEHRRHKII